jgi:hypothetical protein
MASSNRGLQAIFFLALATILGFVIFFAIPLSCPGFTTDKYTRYNGESMSSSLQFFCLADAKTARDRSSIVQLLLSLLASMLALYAVMVAHYAFAMFAEKGLSARLAAVLLQHPAPLGAARLFRPGLQPENRDKLQKSLILVGALALPLIVTLLSAIAPQAFQQTTVRDATVQVDTTGIASSTVLSQFNSRSWKGLVNNSRIFAANTSMAFFKTNDIRRPHSSGLQTVYIKYPISGPERIMAVLPLSNIMPESFSAVPLNTSDFEIAQKLLLLDQRCSFRFLSDGLFDIYREPGWTSDIMDSLLTTSLLNDTGTQYTEADKRSLMEVAMNTQGRLVYMRSMLQYQVDYDVSLYAEWRLPYYMEPSAMSKTEVKARVQYKWGRTPDGQVALYTAQARPTTLNSTGHLICSTKLVPITASVTIPPGASATQRIRSYVLDDSLPPAAEYMISQALNFSSQAVDLMQQPGMTAFAETVLSPFGEHYTEPQNDIRACGTSSLTRGAKSTGPSSKTSVQVYHTAGNDSCVGTEFDHLFRAYLLQLTYEPGPVSQWSWGQLVTMARPDRSYCSLMVVLLCMQGALLALLHSLVGCACSSEGQQEPPQQPIVMPDGSLLFVPQESEAVFEDEQIVFDAHKGYHLVSAAAAAATAATTAARSIPGQHHMPAQQGQQRQQQQQQLPPQQHMQPAHHLHQPQSSSYPPQFTKQEHPSSQQQHNMQQQLHGMPPPLPPPTQQLYIPLYNEQPQQAQQPALQQHQLQQSPAPAVQQAAAASAVPSTRSGTRAQNSAVVVWQT